MQTTNINKHRYARYSTGFDSKETLMFPNGEFSCNVVSFGADMSSSLHIGNKKKDPFTRIGCYNSYCRKKVFNQLHKV